MTELKRVRTENHATQDACAKLLGVSLRSYKDYENNPAKVDSIKYRYLLEQLTQHFTITENQGILPRDFIVRTCAEIFPAYDVTYGYLFGSYAKGQARGDSDVDLLIATSCSGLKYFELVEKLRENLHKKVDLLDVAQLNNNQPLLHEILQTGVKIYGSC